MISRFPRLALSALLGLALLATFAPAAVFAQSPGDASFTLNVGDSAAGGDVNITFEKVYSNTTTDGTDVFIYVPLGAIGDESVDGMDPSWDPNPGDDFDPCPSKFDTGDYLITQAQVDGLGDMLTDQIVAVDVDHYGPIGLADPADPNSDALVVLAYNVLDDFYYDCAENTYTAGYFAPDFISTYGMNIIVTDTFDWANRVGGSDPVYEGVIGHELEHLLMNYSDAGELSWVDEGLADMAIFFNGWGDTNDSHLLYHQVFHRETSLTRWGGGLENYGASYTFFLYLWEQAGGNGPLAGADQFDAEYNDFANDNTGGDLLMQLIFEEQADGMVGVQNAIDDFNTASHPGIDDPLPSAEALFKNWALAIYLDSDDEGVFDFQNLNFGDAITRGWTIELANDLFFLNRGQYKGNVSLGRWEHSPRVPTQTALPFGVSYETFRNPGPTWELTFDGDDTTAIEPYTGNMHWYAGYESQSDHVLNVDTAISGGESLDFWTWYFIEEGWDFGFVEYTTDGGATWTTLPLYDDSATEVTTDDDPHGNNTEGNGLTGTSGGAYFVDAPVYIHLNGDVPAGADGLRFRYSTDAAYLDTGWFVDDVEIDDSAATLSSDPGDWFLTTGEQDNNWVVQVVSDCDLTPTIDGDEVDGLPGYIYRFEGDEEHVFNGTSKCLGATGQFVVVISNMPTGDLTFLDANYTFTLVNTGNKGGNSSNN